MKKYPPVDWTSFQPQPVIGVDEAGRGCLAGPVFSSAVILTKKSDYPDSKSISPDKRNLLAKKIMNEHTFAWGMASVEEIEQLNILQAALLSMKRAILQLTSSTAHILVDGHILIPNLPKTFYQTTFVKGDQRVSPISAASIIAKVKRDEWITRQDEQFPKYGFAIHKGYATAQHRKAIAQYGPCPLHRNTFKGVREYI